MGIYQQSRSILIFFIAACHLAAVSSNEQLSSTISPTAQSIDSQACSVVEIALVKEDVGLCDVTPNSKGGCSRPSCNYGIHPSKPIDVCYEKGFPLNPKGIMETNATLSQVELHLSWEVSWPVAVNLSNIEFSFQCDKNCTGEEKFIPGNTVMLTDRSLTITGLGHYVQYKFKFSIYKKASESTAATNTYSTGILLFTTFEGCPGPVRNASFSKYNVTHRALSWKPPHSPGGPDLWYGARCYLDGQSLHPYITPSMVYPIAEDVYQEMDECEIYAYTAYGQSPLVRIDGAAKPEQQELNLILVLIGVGTSSLCLFVTIVFIFCWRRARKNLQNSYTSRRRELRMNTYLMNRIMSERHSSTSDIEIRDYGEGQYDDVIDSAFVEESQIELISKLGEGQFAEVFKAIGTNIANYEGKVIVAVKMLKASADSKDISDFKSEARLHHKIGRHDHIINLFGYNLLTDQKFVVAEFAQFGDLRSFLIDRKDSDGLSINNFLSFMWMIADGMQFLSSKSIVHRDLACRNILVAKGLKCKISDLGLSREISTGGIYDHMTRGKMPIKWMAPEAIFKQQSSEKSDVWSFGIVCWEIVNFGQTPYPGYVSLEVMELLKHKFRMKRPETCPQNL